MTGDQFARAGVGDPTFEKERMEGRERFHNMTPAQRQEHLTKISTDANTMTGPEKVFARGWMDEFQARAYRMDSERPSIILRDWLRVGEEKC